MKQHASSAERIGAGGRPANAQRRTREQIDALVLDLLRRADRPMSAYDLSASASVRGASIVPNQVYRTVARLIDANAVGRIETLNAYVAGRPDGGYWLICSVCRMVELTPLPGLDLALDAIARGRGFSPSARVVEVLGQCSTCRRAQRVHAE